jgi:flagellar motor switch protein FliN
MAKISTSDAAKGATERSATGAASMRKLPPYTRSLLRIRVPVVVTLAQNRQPLHRILELGPGSMIQFEKSCEEMLELSVGESRVAAGEAIKIGDKFGLRITSIVMPEERFHTVKRDK